MDLLSREALRALIEERCGPCVSLFLPTHRVGEATQQDPIRLKNLLREAEGQLAERGLRPPEVRQLLAAARELVSDTLFWSYQADGLALFISPDAFDRWRLPIRLDELVVVGDRFHIKPLLSQFSGDGRFYVLALSQNQLRLLRGTRHSVSEMELSGVPGSLAEVLRLDKVEKQLHFHTGTPSAPGARPALFHGHGAAADDRHKEDMKRFFKRVDQELQTLLGPERAPLVLAGVDYLLSLYREAATYPHLVAATGTGNPDRMGAEDLHAAAWSAVAPWFERELDEAAARFEERLGTGLASAQLREVLPAAHLGRVETLFVAVGVQRWGQPGPNGGKALEHGTPEPGDQDLLDLAAVQTLLNGGTVYAVAAERVPSGADLAAIFRY